MSRYTWTEINEMGGEELDRIIEEDMSVYGENYCVDNPHTENFTFTTRIPEDPSKSHNGGDYEEWESYRHIRNGLFAVFTHSSCDFDDCGTGYEGIEAVSEAYYQSMMESEKRLEEEAYGYSISDDK